MKKWYSFFLALCLTITVGSQVVTNYNKKWFIGLNTGATWHTTDIQTKLNSGWGFYFGKSYNYEAGRLFSFDLRARYLKGWWYGQDSRTTEISDTLSVLATEPTNYLDSVGFAVRNFQTETYRLAFELAIHANRFRERTRWDPYIFGGIGLTWSQSYGDLLRVDTTLGASSLYNYDPNNLSQANLRRYQDGVFETALDGSKQNKFNLNVMPSLGFGLVYQVGKNTTLGFEHKTTFTGIDSYDGYSKVGKYKQDIYHYSNLYLQFRFGRGDKEVSEENTSYPPQIRFTTPSTSYKEVNEANYILQADVKRVFGKENLTFLQDGSNNNAYQYSEKSERFSAQVSLKEGLNVFVLFGVNQFGQDSDTVSLYFKPVTNPTNPTNPSGGTQTTNRPLPIVSYTQPGRNPLVVSNNRYAVEANVLNVEKRENIQVWFNGAQRTDFQYNLSSKKLYLSVMLNEGSNTVRILATNTVGSDDESTQLVYQKPQTIPAPEVQFTDPNVSPLTVNDNRFTLRAVLKNVKGSSFVQFKQNGQASSNFSFNANTGEFSAQVICVAGSNIFELYGSNESGSASDQTEIKYTRSSPKPPIVTITQPSQASTTSSTPNFQFAGKVLNVSEKTQVTLTINGENRSNFSFNSSNGTVSAAVQLMTGNNVIRLSGSNADGMDTKEVTIVYRPTQTQQPPVVNFVNPSTSPTQVNQNTFELVASVSHVETQSGVKVTVNGVNTNFTFNSGQVKLTLNLVEGANVVEVKGTNTAGTDSKTSTLVYRKPNTVNPPVVSFIQPDQSPKNVDQSNFTVVARVNNVSTKSEITVRINGQSTSQFVFTASSHEVKFDLNLIEGNNTIEVSGTNSAGSDSKTVQLVYRPKVVSPPTVKITAPEVNPYNTQVATYTLEAKLTNISNVDPIVLKWNNVSNNSYQYNASTGILKLPMELYEGENNLTIQVSNADGTASDQMKIVYKKPVVVNAPTVVFTKPSEAGSEVNSPVYKMDAKVFNVESAQQIDFKMNGSMVSSANWSYNSTSKIWSYSANLEEGNNFFELVATNEGGSALAQTNIRYIKPVVPCEKPKVVFQQPTKNGVVFQEANQNVQFTLQGNNAELMSVKLNGAETQRFTATNGIYNLTVALQNGNNVVEVNARNNCGSVSAYLTMVYEPKTEPCKIPTIQMLVPSQNSLIVEETFIKLELGVAEVVNESKIQLTLNGTSISFIFDAGTKILRSDVNLVVGKNVIEVTATNDCGSKKMKIEVERLACNEPGYTLVNASIPNGQSSANRTFSLDLALSHITNESQIKVKLNNQQETFDFDDNHVLHFDKVLNLGSQTLTITLTNSCGTKTFIHKVTILKSDVQGPTVSFTTPNTNPITVVTQNYQVEFKCTNILNASNIAFKLNGSVLPVVFDYNSQKGQVNVNLKQGVNTVEVTAVNNAGSASATSTIVLALESKQNPPEISLDKTYGRLEIVKPGIQKISGSVSNITDPKNLEIKVNGKLVTRVNTSVVNGKLNFDFTLNMEITNPSQTVEIGASNSAGRDKKYLAFKLETQPVRTTPVPNTPQGGK